MIKSGDADLPEPRQDRDLIGFSLACMSLGLFAIGDAAAKIASRDHAVLRTLFPGRLFAVIPILVFIR